MRRLQSMGGHGLFQGVLQRLFDPEVTRGLGMESSPFCPSEALLVCMRLRGLQGPSEPRGGLQNGW